MLGLEIISNPNKMILLELEMADDQDRDRDHTVTLIDRFFGSRSKIDQ